MVLLPEGWRAFAKRHLSAILSSNTSQKSLSMRLASGAVWSITTAVLLQGGSLASSIMVARLLGAEGFGELSLLRSTVLLLASLVGPALGSAATRYVAQRRATDKDSAGRVIQLLLRVAIVVGALISVTGLLGANIIADRLMGTPSLTVPLRWAALAAFPVILGGVQIGVLAGVESFRTVTKVIAIESALNVALPIVGTVVSGVTGAVVGYFIAGTIALFPKHLALMKVLAAEGISLQHDRVTRELSVLPQFALPSLLIALSITPAEWFARVLLSHQANGFVEVAIFTAAQSWTSVIQLVPSRIASASMPVMANLFGSNNLVALRKTVLMNLAVVSVVGAAIGIPVCLLAPHIMSAYGSGFQHGSGTLVVLAASNAIAVISMVCATTFEATGLVWIQVAHRVFWGLAMVSLAIVWQRRGALGVAMAYAGGIAGLLVLQVATIWRSKRWRPARNDDSLAKSPRPLDNGR